MSEKKSIEERLQEVETRSTNSLFLLGIIIILIIGIFVSTLMTVSQINSKFNELENKTNHIQCHEETIYDELQKQNITRSGIDIGLEEIHQIIDFKNGKVVGYTKCTLYESYYKGVTTRDPMLMNLGLQIMYWANDGIPATGKYSCVPFTTKEVCVVN